jgi:hypothetical protein
MPEMFVNPLPGVKVEKFLAFDFPSVPLTGGGNEYEGEAFLGNTFLPDLPAVQELYNRLGNPPRDQGKPKIRERDPEAEDPSGPQTHDQVLDIDNAIQINHTGRLSGDLIKLLFGHCKCDFYSEIVVTATNVKDNTAPSITLATRCDPVIAKPKAKNVWFFKNPATKQELVFTLDKIIDDPYTAGLRAENVYKMIIEWKFWTACKDPENEKPRTRLPISGYDESLSFEVISATELV